jgi:hypothetical protein
MVVHIAGARLASRPDLTLAALAARLSDESRRLDELEYGTLAVRAHLRSAYQDLTERSDHGLAARLYRALGRLEGHVARADAVAWASGEPDLMVVADGLDLLVDMRLIGALSTGSYLLPGLVRLHAREVSLAEERPTRRSGRPRLGQDRPPL